MTSNDNPGYHGYDPNAPTPNGNGGFGNSGANGHANGSVNGAGSTIPGGPRPAAIPGGPDFVKLQRSLLEPEGGKRFNAFDYLRLVWRGKWIVLASFILVTLATAYYTFSLPYIYESSVQISLSPKDQGMDLFSHEMYYSPDRNLKNELQKMTSQPVFDSTALLLIRREKLDSVHMKDSLIPVYSVVKARNQYKLGRGGTDEYNDAVFRQTAAALRKMITVKPSKDADIIEVTTRSGDPTEAALITNMYAVAYDTINLHDNQAKAKSLSEYLTERLKATQGKLDTQERRLNSYQKQQGVTGDEVSGGDLAKAKSDFAQTLANTNIEISTVTRTLEESRHQLAQAEPEFSETTSEALPASIGVLNQQIAEESASLQSVLASNPAAGSEIWKQNQYAAMRNHISELRRQLKEDIDRVRASKAASLPGSENSSSVVSGLNALKQRILESEIKLSELNARRNATQAEIGRLETQIGQIPDQQMNLGRLGRETKGLEKMYEDLNKKNNEQLIDQKSQSASVRVLEDAQPNPKPISPNRPVNLIMGAIIGVSLGIGIVLLIAYADTTVHSPDELEKNGFIVLTAIAPIQKSLEASEKKKKLVTFGDGTRKPSPHLVSYLDPKSTIAESYRSLRTAIQFASIESAAKLILVTSSIPQEGKSTTSVNLATVLAQSGARTLIVDCDLRRPILHSIFGMGKEPGVVNALLGTLPVEKAVRPTGIPNLDVLTSGAIPPNPSELLGSRRMFDLLQELRGMYDMVVIDSPPVGAVTDAVILSTRVDATIAVVRAHKTRMEFIEKTREDLDRVSRTMMGVVLNEFDATQSYGSTYKYYRYYKYYSYYGPNDETGRRKDRRANAARMNAEVTAPGIGIPEEESGRNS